MRLEPIELRVMAIAFGVALENFLGEQGFTPGGDEALGVEVSGMEGPESHGGGSICLLVVVLRPFPMNLGLINVPSSLTGTLTSPSP